MNKYLLTLDLGTTNIKVGLYTTQLTEVLIVSLKVKYLDMKDFIEFNPEYYWGLCKEGIKKILGLAKIDSKNIATITITGQAETLVLIDNDNNPLRNAISWMDNRSFKECEFLKTRFDNRECYDITGLPELITTWPVTKILWIKKNEKDIFNRVKKYLLIKDYIVFKLTGRLLSEYSVSSFSYYFDIQKKVFWENILNFIGISTMQLPELIEPCSIVEETDSKILEELGFSEDIQVNIGILDHFAGMIGSGNIRPGIISETTGTVLAIATLVKTPSADYFPIPCHCGPFNNHVLLPVCESGGICLEWFKNNFYPDDDFRTIDINIEKKYKDIPDNPIIFLPYIIGANSPEFNQDVKGGFLGISIEHKKVDFAVSVLEGIGFLLKKNIDYLENKGVEFKSLITLGGASKSNIWNIMKANITRKNLLIPSYAEATSFGAAVIGLLKYKNLDNIGDILKNYLNFTIIKPDEKYFQYYGNVFVRFNELYNCIENFSLKGQKK